MNSGVTVEGNEKVLALLRSVPIANFGAAKKAWAVAIFEGHKQVVKNASGGLPGLNRRTGGLSRSLKAAVTGDSVRTLSGKIYTNSVYAPIHEYGGTIRAKNAYRGVPGGPYLNIPTDDNQTASGVQRLNAKQVFERGGYIARSSGGSYVVIMPQQKKAAKQKRAVDPNKKPKKKQTRNKRSALKQPMKSFTSGATTMFFLVKDVYITPRLEMHSTAIAQIPTLLSTFRNAFREELRKRRK